MPGSIFILLNLTDEFNSCPGNLYLFGYCFAFVMRHRVWVIQLNIQERKSELGYIDNILGPPFFVT